jgi:hypothetical protein
MSSTPGFYKELADAIYNGDSHLLSQAASRNFDENKVTLTEALTVGGKRFPANTMLRIQKPVSVR